MEKQSNNSQQSKEITIIGCGIAGLSTAFYLRELGFKITIIDPKINSLTKQLDPLNGTEASLGILMGNIFSRSKGRSWELRKRSLELWPKWTEAISKITNNVNIQSPLIKLAASKIEHSRLIELYKNKKHLGLSLLNKEAIHFWSDTFEKRLFGGIVSLKDGRINPTSLIEGILNVLDKYGITKINDSVISIEKGRSAKNKRWIINLKNQTHLKQDSLIICSALSSQILLKPLGYSIDLESILGQVINLELQTENSNLLEWPAVVNYQGINFIHHKTNEILMGATVEKSKTPSSEIRENMHNMNDSAPNWIKTAIIKSQLLV